MKDKKKILIIKLGPWDTLESSNIRALSMAKGFLASGYSIDWIGVKSPYSYPLLNKELIGFADHIHFIMAENSSLHIGKRNSGNMIKRLFHGACHKLMCRISVYDYYKKIAVHILDHITIQREYDYLVSISNPPTSHLAAENLLKSKRIKACRWIEYWGDPIVGDVSEIHKKSMKRQVKAERSLLSGCDKIVFTSQCTLADEKKIHSAFAKKMFMCPTPYLEKKISVDDDIFTIGYYGAYRERNRNIIPFYNACTQLGDGFHINIIGNGDKIPASTNTITVKPRSDVSNYEKETDLYVCILCRKGTQLPGKIYQYAGSNRPVLVILDGEHGREHREYLEQFRRFYFCENREDDIIRSIREIADEKRKWEPCRQLEAKTVAEIFLN